MPYKKQMERKKGKGGGKLGMDGMDVTGQCCLTAHFVVFSFLKAFVHAAEMWGKLCLEPMLT